jgi:hypothetical protein
MSVHRQLRQQDKREALQVITTQLDEAEEEMAEYMQFLPTEEELRDLEIEEDRRQMVINGNYPDSSEPYGTLDEYNTALASLTLPITEDEQVIVESVRRRIRHEEEWRAFWLADYYASSMDS